MAAAFFRVFMPSFPEDYILIGDVGTAHGIKGWNRLRSFSEPKEGILSYPNLLGARSSESFALVIEKHQFNSAKILVKFEGIDNRNQAESLTGTKLYVARDALKAPEEGEYYWHDLVGLDVIGKNGETLGRVTEIFETPAHEVMVLKHGKTKRMIPFVLHDIVESVSLDEQTIKVNWAQDYFDDDA